MRHRRTDWNSREPLGLGTLTARKHDDYMTTRWTTSLDDQMTHWCALLGVVPYSHTHTRYHVVSLMLNLACSTEIRTHPILC